MYPNDDGRQTGTSDFLRVLDTKLLYKLKKEYDRLDLYKVGEITPAQAVEAYSRVGRTINEVPFSTFPTIIIGYLI